MAAESQLIESHQVNVVCNNSSSRQNGVKPPQTYYTLARQRHFVTYALPCKTGRVLLAFTCFHVCALRVISYGATESREWLTLKKLPIHAE